MTAENAMASGSGKGGAGSPAKPSWIRARVPEGQQYRRLRALIDGLELHTVCDEARCPNVGACWNSGRATILILGRACTRGCRFCNIQAQRPAPPDPDEPARVAEAVRATGLSDVVITSVTRDDLPDGGARLWAETILRIRDAVPGIVIEVLIPDFQGVAEHLDLVLDARPDVLGHNLETVPRLYPAARPGALYPRSLDVLRRGRRSGLVTKTSLMVGLGESEAEVLAAARDAREAGCDILYIGQYLQPTREHLPVRRYVEPPEFERYREAAEALGFPVVVSGPLVRSSYHTGAQADFLRRAKGQGAVPPQE